MKYSPFVFALFATITIMACKQTLTAESGSTKAKKELTEEESMRKQIMESKDITPKDKKRILSSNLADMESARMAGVACLTSCPIQQLPYTLSAEAMAASVKGVEIDEGGSIGQQIAWKKYECMSLIHTRNYGLFSRDMMPTYAFVAYLGEKNGYYTLVYRSQSDVSEINYPVEFFIATLNKDGCIISEQKIASLSSPLHITTATIYPDGHIVSQKVNQIWEKAPEEAGYENNKVIKREITTTDNYHIGSDGKIHG